MEVENYRKRIAEKQLDLKLRAFGAALITGPKGCGKTTIAKTRANSIIEFQDEDRRENLLETANTKPSLLLRGEKPILFDEWQDAPKIWGAVRKACDDSNVSGLFLLTGSTSQRPNTPHTGTLRISEMLMYPMSLYESGESTGEISLADLFNGDFSSFNRAKESQLSFDDLVFAICRGGWPKAVLAKGKDTQLEISKDLFKQTYKIDISNVDGVTRNSEIGKRLLKSYARVICQLTKDNTVVGDVQSDFKVSEDTILDYETALKKLFIVNNLPAWCPDIRSKTAIRSKDKKNFVDPSIAVAALGIGPDFFNTDMKTLGFLFESLVIRDLRVYSSYLGGELSYYRDRYGLEADVVLHLEDGRYALVEAKFGGTKVQEGINHLNELERLIKKNNEGDKKSSPIRMPDLKIVITGTTPYALIDKSGVLIIPLALLKD